MQVGPRSRKAVAMIVEISMTIYVNGGVDLCPRVGVEHTKQLVIALQDRKTQTSTKGLECNAHNRNL